MKVLVKALFLSVFGVMVVNYATATPELAGVMFVDVTSDTAADAKSSALGQARRQILTQVLGQYANPTLVQNAVGLAKDSELVNLIASSSIDGEKSSDTTYSANITMFIDANASANWLRDNNIQHWINSNSGVEGGVAVMLEMSDKMQNWIELQQIVRTNNIDLDTKYIMGMRALVMVPGAQYQKFVRLLRNSGWRYASQDSEIKLWK